MKEFAPFRLDIGDQCLWRDDQRVPLTPKAFAVLQYLVERAGRLVTQNELLEALWPDTFVQPEVLKSQILDVRAALGDRPRDPLFIETLPRRGYRFIAPVRDALTTDPGQGERGAKSLVGRDPALEELLGCLKRASNAERQIVFVTGEQGMGKTTLVEAFLERVNAGDAVQIARGQCLEGYGMVKEPYYPVLEALGQMARGPGAEPLARVLETQAPTWLMQLPGLLKPEHRATLQRELLGATRERMIREICEALEKLTAENTLVLLFEDLHWADHSTVDLIAAIAHRRFPARLLLLGTYRPVDLVLAQHPLKQASHFLKAHKLCREIALSPLVETEVEEYLAKQSGSSQTEASVHLLARWIRKQTEGNPLFMVTVIEHLVELGHIAVEGAKWRMATPLDQIEITVPDTLRQVIELQIERLSPREQLILEAASVQGNLFSAVVTAAVLEIDMESVDVACDKLAQQNHFVRTSAAERLPDGSFSQRYEFTHAAFRNVFYNRLAPARRAKLHRRCGETIEQMRAGHSSEVAAELAGHFEQCEDWPRAVKYLSLTAQNAWRRFAYREAISVLEHALEQTANLPETGRVPWELETRERLAAMEHALHDPSRAIPALEALAARAAACGKAEVEARALMMLTIMRASDDCRACAPLLDRIRSLTTEHKGPMAICLFGWNERLAQEHVAYVAEVRPTLDRVAAAPMMMDHAYLQWASCRYADCVKNAQENLPVLLESGQVIRFVLGRDLLAMNFAQLGQLGTALDIFEANIESAYKNEAPLRAAMPLVFKGWVLLHAMDYQGVADICAATLPALDGPFTLDRRCIGLRLAAAAELGLGRVDSALKALIELRDALEQRPVMLSWYWRIPLHLDIADAYLAKGDLAEARLAANRSIELASATAERAFQASAWETSVRVAILEEDMQRAESDMKQAVQAMDGFEVPLAAWRVHRTAAAVYQHTGNAELTRRHLESGRAAVLALAKSLDTRPTLREGFLASSQVAELLDSKATIAAK